MNPLEWAPGEGDTFSTVIEGINIVAFQDTVGGPWVCLGPGCDIFHEDRDIAARAAFAAARAMKAPATPRMRAYLALVEADDAVQGANAELPPSEVEDAAEHLFDLKTWLWGRLNPQEQALLDPRRECGCPVGIPTTSPHACPKCRTEPA
jgi:hypothetical protein